MEGAKIQIDRDFVLIKSFLSLEEQKKLLDFYALNEMQCRQKNRLYQRETPMNENVEAEETKLLQNIYIKFIDTITKDVSPFIIKRYLSCIANCFIDIESFSLLFNKFKGKMVKHYDGYSDWNMVVSIGATTELSLTRGKQFLVENGDVYLFNGNHKYHSVKVTSINACTIWKDYSSFQHHDRICFQLRNCVSKSIATFINRHQERRFKRLRDHGDDDKEHKNKKLKIV